MRGTVIDDVLGKGGPITARLAQIMTSRILQTITYVTARVFFINVEQASAPTVIPNRAFLGDVHFQTDVFIS